MSTESTTTPASMFDVGGTCSYSTDGAFCGPYFEDFENWHWIKYLLILNTLSVTFSIMYTVMEQFWDPTGTLSIAVVLPIFIAAFLFTVLLTILALISILRNLRRRTHNQSSPPSREQRQLLTTVIYITPPNLTNLPGLLIGEK
ncbi:unnamed protein product [Toxocara canis]|uniref:Transmembrane protein n=1 Tax=Toxocara canis TaxID=6265 RepID=A0A183V7I6_TOXCA|nr:unnamed protein product [Toxocara canis]